MSFNSCVCVCVCVCVCSSVCACVCVCVCVCVSLTGGEWRLKYERAIRESDFNKKRLQQEFEDKLETEKQAKRHVERRVSL